MYIDLSALPLTLLKRFDTNVHTVITSMQKKIPNILNLAAVLQNGTNISILGLSLLQGLPVVRLNLPKETFFTNAPRHAVAGPIRN